MTRWQGIDLRTAPADSPIAIGGTISPAVLADAARRGVFATPTTVRPAVELNRMRHSGAVEAGTLPVLDSNPEPYSVLWWCPDPRPVLRFGEARLHRQARRLARREELVTTLDAAFDDVLQGCRDHHRLSWMDDHVADAYAALHRSGAAFSSEVWRDGTLLGGAIGLRSGAVTSLDTAFYREDHMSRLAVLNALTRLGDAGVPWVDCQVPGALSASLGAGAVPRSEFLDAVSVPTELQHPVCDPRPASTVLAALGGSGS